jgi:hypothetical protein
MKRGVLSHGQIGFVVVKSKYKFSTQTLNVFFFREHYSRPPNITGQPGTQSKDETMRVALRSWQMTI